MADCDDSKPVCKFGGSCYRKNKEHLRNYSHPEREKKSLDDASSDEETKAPKAKRIKTDQKETNETNSDSDLPETRPTDRNEDEKNDNSDEEGLEMTNEEIIKKQFFLQIPADFLDFWEFCSSLKPESPEEALEELLGLSLVGPYDVIAGKITGKQTKNMFLHWRYYYDPPEFVTVIKGDETTDGYHMGYFRDEPLALPSFVASNSAESNCEFTSLGGNLFSAVNSFIVNLMKSTKDKAKIKSLQNLQSSLVEKSKERKHSLDLKNAGIKARNKKVVTKMFHKAGIVVPVDDNEVGYRPLTLTDSALKKLLKNIVDHKQTPKGEVFADELHEIITLIQFANDECDYGMGMELGMNLFCFGHEIFHNTISNLLPMAYQLLGRHEFAMVTEEHLKNRRRGSMLSLL